MKKMKGASNGGGMITAGLLIMAVALLLGSAVGSTRAALTYYSEEYRTQLATPEIGVALVETGEKNEAKVVASDAANATKESLLGDITESDFIIGKKYKEELSVKNTGDMDQYVRVILYKSWKDTTGQGKDQALSPDLIQLGLTSGNGWIIDDSQSTSERTVLYYSGIVAPGTTTKALSDKISISTDIQKMVTTSQDGNIITTTFEYNGIQFTLDAEVNAVQTHNAAAAIKSAWGVDVAIANDGTLSLK